MKYEKKLDSFCGYFLLYVVINDKDKIERCKLKTTTLKMSDYDNDRHVQKEDTGRRGCYLLVVGSTCGREAVGIDA